jgi:hypothetical protein
MSKLAAEFLEKYVVLAALLWLTSAMTLICYPVGLALYSAASFQTLSSLAHCVLSTAVIPVTATLLYVTLSAASKALVGTAPVLILFCTFTWPLSFIAWAWSITGALPAEGAIFTDWLWPSNVELPILVASALGKVCFVVGTPGLLLWSGFRQVTSLRTLPRS